MKNKLHRYKKTHIGDKRLSPETQMMHYGYDPVLSEGSVKCPNFQTSTFVFSSAQHGKDFFNYDSGRVALPEGEEIQGLIYSRFNNPALEILQNRIGLWDEAEDCVVTGTGMSAIATTLCALSGPGDVIIYSEPIYGGTDILLKKLLSKFGIQSIAFVSKDGEQGIQKAVEAAKSRGTVSAMLIETPSNPNNDLVDIAYCAQIINTLHNADQKRALLLVDNTMAGPAFQQPLSLGADVCLYSLTKYIGGHSDIVGGSASGSKEIITKIRSFRNIFGTTMDPNTAWLALRSLETVKIRMSAASQNAIKVAHFLQQHEKVTRVHHLSLLQPHEPQYQLYQKQCSGPGSTFSFEIVGDEAAAFRLLDAMQIIQLAVSLGGTETLAQHPASMTHSGIAVDRRLAIGITENLIRVSVGIENPDDIIADIEQALQQV